MADRRGEIGVGNALSMALFMYANEPCRICGRNISIEDVRDAVFAGYSDRFPGSRAAHKRCWEGMVDTAIAYQIKHGDLNAVDWFKEEEKYCSGIIPIDTNSATRDSGDGPSRKHYHDKSATED